VTAFEAMVGTLFGDPNLALPALWRAGGAGSPVAVPLLWRSPDAPVVYGERRLSVTSREAEIRTVDAPTLAEGDTLEIAGSVMPVLAPPESDADRLVWTVSLGEPE
jgi:hypothetical protein